ncbi:MAG: CocE/NonD family hydrolase [Pseudomonadales bacterium]|nr:CocE/NonD family hydrolase [Pseudomonadales bacterium]
MNALRRSLAWMGYFICFISSLGISLAYGVYDFTYYDDISIYSDTERDDGCPSGDGVRISANVFIPHGGPSDSFPALVLVPGWANDKYEYIKQAEYLATKGYVVLSYSPRGMGDSEGNIEIVSSNDVSDFCAAVDWLIENSPTDSERIGAYGMSYGGGVSFVGLAFDERIKAIATASSWADLKNSLFEANTPNQIWIGNLIFGGQVGGSLDPEVFTMKDALFAGENLELPTEWARVRSALTYLDIYNQRQTFDLVTGETRQGVPIYISKNNGDYLFKTNRLLELYSKLEGPKKLDTNLGTHSQQEQVGMDLRPNVTWDNIHLWFDYWLRGIDNGVLEEPPVSMRVKNLRYRDYFSQWPSQNVENDTFYLNSDELGGYLAPGLMDKDDAFSFWGVLESGVTVGAPVLTSWLETFGLIHEIDLNKIDTTLSAEFFGDPLEETLKIRGTIDVNVWLSVEKPRALLVSYLFDINENGEAKLITHGPASLLDAVPGQPVELNFEMAAIAYDVEPGNQLALFFDGGEWLYYSPQEDPFQIELLIGDSYPSSISMPIRIAEEDSNSNSDDGSSDNDNGTVDRGTQGGSSNSADGSTISEGGSMQWLILLALSLLISRTFQRPRGLI